MTSMVKTKYFLVILGIIALIPKGLEASNQLVNNADEHLIKPQLAENSNENYENNEEMERLIKLDQRFKAMLPYLYEAYLEANLGDDEAESEESYDKRYKKDSPFRDYRRQTARWDIGYGKRGGMKPNAFLDALYGKRSSLKFFNPKMTFGRKQQWDIQYGK
ncbi:hypothetical protein BpHYR1_026537 [Brachionus plicatilis]|uniref:Uncharacterized protein n=1 Tax=Brachionus plicatilis TaxID=10195 RepID=A0A3M7P741_BRAPC|nr:hypothetical protein BpHYR1_026537 [Brachionus plicatilis]